MTEAAHMEVRPAELADVGSILQIYAPYVTDTSITFELEVPSCKDLRCRMTVRPRLPWIVAETELGIRGYAYAYPHSDRPAYRWAVNCSVYVAQSNHGRGVGGLLYGRLLDELRALGYVSVMARITLPNEPSVRLHEGVAFTPVGVLEGVGFKGGRWHDVGWWTLRLVSGRSDRPPEPVKWPPLE